MRPANLRNTLLCLVRHGDAKSADDDPQRGLSEKGREDAERMAAWAARIKLPISEIRHSRKLRAEQTAAIFARHFPTTVDVTAVSGLDPLDDVGPMADAMARVQGCVMVVGHLPFLSRLASQLVVRDAEQAIVDFPTAGLVVLMRQDGQWLVACGMQPDLL